MNDDRDVLREIEALIGELQAHPDAAVGERVQQLLQDIDAVHRTALTHLVNGIRGMAGEAFLNRLIADPAVRLLLMSYDLIAVTRRIHAEEAVDAARGHLHARGVDVELTDVVGGVVYARIHGLDGDGAEADAVRRDVEAALTEGLPGFQELVVGERQMNQPVVQLGGLERRRAPVYRRAAGAEDLAPGQLLPVDLEGTPVLLVRLADGWYAMHDRCGDSPLPLQFGTIEGTDLVCSWHGCRYDVRSGRRRDVDDPTAGVPVYPVAVKDGDVRVAVGTAPAGQTQ